MHSRTDCIKIIVQLWFYWRQEFAGIQNDSTSSCAVCAVFYRRASGVAVLLISSKLYLSLLAVLHAFLEFIFLQYCLAKKVHKPQPFWSTKSGGLGCHMTVMSCFSVLYVFLSFLRPSSLSLVSVFVSFLLPIFFLSVLFPSVRSSLSFPV